VRRENDEKWREITIRKRKTNNAKNARRYEKIPKKKKKKRRGVWA